MKKYIKNKDNYQWNKNYCKKKKNTALLSLYSFFLWHTWATIGSAKSLPYFYSGKEVHYFLKIRMSSAITLRFSSLRKLCFQNKYYFYR